MNHNLNLNFTTICLFSNFRLTFEEVEKKKQQNGHVENENEKKTITVEPYVRPNRGPYLFNEPKK